MKSIIKLCLILTTCNAFSADLDCYSEVLETKCGTISQGDDPAHSIICESFIKGHANNALKRGGEEVVSKVDGVADVTDLADTNVISRYFEMNSRESELREIINNDIDTIKDEIPECAVKK